MKTQTFKSISFVFIFHALSVVNMLLCHQNLMADTVWLALQIILCIAALPCYFFVKSTPASKWIYTLTSLVAHVVFLLLAYHVVGEILDGWDHVLLYLTELFLSATMGMLLLIDVIVNAISKVPKR